MGRRRKRRDRQSLPLRVFGELLGQPRTPSSGSCLVSSRGRMRSSSYVRESSSLHTASLPPISLARSRMPRKPKCPPRPSSLRSFGSMPFPSSRNRNCRSSWGGGRQFGSPRPQAPVLAARRLLAVLLSIHLHDRNSIAGAQNFVLRGQLTTLSRNALCRRSNSVKRPKFGEVTLL
jgi:hypothetical protein